MVSVQIGWLKPLYSWCQNGAWRNFNQQEIMQLDCAITINPMRCHRTGFVFMETSGRCLRPHFDLKQKNLH
ncbi:hypothetical protein OC00_09990 [Xanthomonas vasicola]|nr:hypothetical protein NX07_13265 [Xanthomonas vasicola]KGR54036.1 hypothetical protein NX09_13675 [Xanthomonas vasicola]KGT84145.1 hypothetical protein OC00_09990 [Xanthomonas vasicola]